MSKRKKPQQTSPLLIILPFSLLGVVIAILIVGGSNPSSKSFILSKEQIVEGQRLYDSKCASCHGSQGEGQYPGNANQADASGLIGAPPHNSTGHTWHHGDTMLVDQIKNGSSQPGYQAMPAFGSEFSDEQIATVLGYIKTWWTRDQLVAQATASSR